jgi:hypothetical protein
LLLVHTFIMQTTQIHSVCEICGREFEKPVGLNVHKRTCKIKAAEKEKDAQYEREVVEREKEKKGMFPTSYLAYVSLICDI